MAASRASWFSRRCNASSGDALYLILAPFANGLRVARSARALSALLTMRVRASLHRFSETYFRRPRLERFGLALMRRPARKPDDVEGGTDTAIRIRETFAVDLRHA